jgi:hypothetical protein
VYRPKLVCEAGNDSLVTAVVINEFALKFGILKNKVKDYSKAKKIMTESVVYKAYVAENMADGKKFKHLLNSVANMFDSK